jgi:hypothetical protein
MDNGSNSPEFGEGGLSVKLTGLFFLISRLKMLCYSSLPPKVAISSNQKNIVNIFIMLLS